LLLVRYNPDAPLRTSGKEARELVHKALVLYLEQLLTAEGKVEPIAELDGLNAVVKGNEYLQVVYIGYTDPRIDELWAATSTMYKGLAPPKLVARTRATPSNSSVSA
jgi:hypothetical protein